MIDKIFKRRSLKILRTIIFVAITLWNIYFLTHLIFFTDKFKKPYTNINVQDYLKSNKIYDHPDYLSPEEKVADFLYMVKFLNENYPLEHIDEQVYEIDIESKNNEFLNKIKNTTNDFEFFLTLKQYFSTVKSIHTYLMTPKLSLFENMHVNNMTNFLESDLNRERINYWERYLNNKVNDYSLENIVIYKFIDDKYYETNNFENYITHINDDPIEDFIDKHNSILYKKYNYESNIRYYEGLVFNKVQGEQVLIRLNNGEEINLYFSTEYEFAYLYNDYMSIRQPEIFYIIDEDKRMCYYRIDSFQIEYLNKLKSLSKEVIENRDAFDHIVFDIRNNSGGKMATFVEGVLNFFINNEETFKTKFYTPFTEYHSNFKSKAINNNIVKNPFKEVNNLNNYFYKVNGKIKYGSNKASKIKNMYVLIDQRTGSAADTFAAIMKAGKYAILVGQNTAGEGLGDTSSMFSLPNSGLIISFMGSYGLNKDGKSNSKYGTAPDYYISQDVSDYKKGKDIDFKHESINQIMVYDTQLKFIMNNLIKH